MLAVLYGLTTLREKLTGYVDQEERYIRIHDSDGKGGASGSVISWLPICVKTKLGRRLANVGGKWLNGKDDGALRAYVEVFASTLLFSSALNRGCAKTQDGDVRCRYLSKFCSCLSL